VREGIRWPATETVLLKENGLSEIFDRRLVNGLVMVMQEAGRLIMKIRDKGLDVERKADDSPVTEADRAAEVLIMEALGRLAPGVPVVAEEAASKGDIPKPGDLFFLVDPLDGTKEFIAGRSEFTVNIALISNRQPIFGMVYAPVVETLYFTPEPGMAAEMQLDPFGAPIDEADIGYARILSGKGGGPGLRVVASRSHLNDATREFLSHVEIAELLTAGSSLKFCLLASGKADLYPRLSPTMEWDTAAGHAVLEAAGGSVVGEDGGPFFYGKVDEGFLNGGFIARGGDH